MELVLPSRSSELPRRRSFLVRPWFWVSLAFAAGFGYAEGRGCVFGLQRSCDLLWIHSLEFLDPGFGEKRRVLEQELGVNFSDFLFGLHGRSSVAPASIRVSPMVTSTTILADEHVKDVQFTVTSEELWEWLALTFPRSWFESELIEIRHSETPIHINSSYHIGGVGAGSYIDGPRGGVIKIASFTASNTTIQSLWGLLGHELAHANDWEDDFEMTFLQRVDLLMAIYDRLDDVDRLQSDYLDQINNEDCRVQQRNVATEYWAEIVGFSLAHYYLVPERDREIVEQQLQLIDPEFDLEQAYLSSRHFISELQVRHGLISDSELNGV